MPSEAEPVRISFLGFIFRSLGFFYGPTLMFAGLFCFVLTLFVVIRGKGPFVSLALILIVSSPFLIGIMAAIGTLMTTYERIAMSSTSPKPSEIADGISIALVAPWFGMIMMMPSYAAAVIGSLVRCFSANPDRSPSS